MFVTLTDIVLIVFAICLKVFGRYKGCCKLVVTLQDALRLFLCPTYAVTITKFIFAEGLCGKSYIIC